MMNPSLPGYKVECVGDDISWMRFDDQGQLRAINPEYGFFGVAPGKLVLFFTDIKLLVKSIHVIGSFHVKLTRGSYSTI